MAPGCDYRQEVRFAVVMYGGVSLAIYINGIAQELLRMVRATAEDPAEPGRLAYPVAQGTEAVYRKIGQLLGRQPAAGAGAGDAPAAPAASDPVRVRFVVDILSGTSAGGINGIFLAKALANDESLDELRRLWIAEGDLEVLLNDGESVRGVPGLAAQKPPQALLNGRRMYAKLVAALEGMAAGRPATAPPRSLVDEIDLFVTTTDIRGLPLPLKLADGVVWEKRHKNVFQFRFDRGRRPPLNDFTAANDPLLAFAARCTSSFPFAFEPFELGDMEDLLPKGRPDLAAAWKKDFFPLYRKPAGVAHPDHAYDPAARAFGDGGYLDNKPFGYAIDTLADRTSSLPVDRKLLYIEPSPEHPEDQREPPERPNALENVSAALSLAGEETIREDLQRVLARNRLLERVEHFLSGLEADFDWSARSIAPSAHFSASDLRQRIRDFGPSYGGYHRLKVAAVTDDIATWIGRASGFDLESDQFLAIRYLTRSWRQAHFAPVVMRDETAPPAADGSPAPQTENEFLKRYDLGYRERRLRFVLNRLDQLFPLDARSAKILADRREAAPQGGGEVRDFRAALAALRGSLSAVLKDLRSFGEVLQAFGEDNPLAAILAPMEIGSEQLLGIFAGGAAAGEAEGEAEGKADALLAARAGAFAGFADRLADLLKKTELDAWEAGRRALAAPADPAPAAALAYRLANHYYDQYEIYDLISFPILYSTDVGDELAQVAVHRISPEDARSIFDERKTGRRKLAGTALMHFGAFVDCGFRRNDILWGRLDGAERLIEVLLPGEAHRSSREELLQEAQLAILAEELGELDRGRLGDIVTGAWLSAGSGERNEKALRSLAERELGAAGNDGLQAALRQALLSVGADKLLEFYRRDFDVPREINPRTAVRSLARSTQILGYILEDVGNRYQKDGRPGAWIARLGGWFWGFVEVAVPRSLPNLLFRHGLKLLYLFEALLVAGGALFTNRAAQQLGWTALGVTLLLNLAHLLLVDLIRGRTRLWRGVAFLCLLILLVLSGFGAVALRERAKAWAADGRRGAIDSTARRH